MADEAKETMNEEKLTGSSRGGASDKATPYNEAASE
jgi:hypothetical protein